MGRIGSELSCADNKAIRTMLRTKQVSIENQYLSVTILPEFGGKITSIRRKDLNYEYLWYCPEMLKRNCQVYDDCFSGGIDEIIPNDLPETICNIDFPDHGILWSTSLNYSIDANRVILEGNLTQANLYYKKEISLSDKSPQIKMRYKIENLLEKDFPFIWRIHAAIRAEPGDIFNCSAQKAVCIDPVWSRHYTKEPFGWPSDQMYRANILPEADGTTEFLFLYELYDGKAKIQKACGRTFSCLFDIKTFPYVCYFASYGGFKGKYFAVLEPATTKGLTVNEAQKDTACSILKGGNTIWTDIVLSCE
jgi:hypothetical protein